MPWIDPERYDVVQYYVGWFALCLLALYIFRQIYGKLLNEADSKAQVVTQGFKSFQRMFVIVYLIMMAADWVQGPYVYALYKLYGYDKGEIGLLFIAGFGSSLVFGTVVGSLADKYGRKGSCLTFGVLYSLSCLTKHSPNFHVLLFGRVLGGVSTSILFSAFESWMVHEHHDASYPEEWLGITFSLATAGNGIIAIASGVIAGVVRDAFGPVAPFDLSLLLLIVGSVVVAVQWKENYGDSNVAILSTFTNGFGRIFEDKKVLYLGISQSFFEGTMYIFVFMWTDALASTSTKEILHGWIFATFMVCVLLGSNIFNVLLKMGAKVERFTVYMFFAAGLALLVPAFVKIHSVRMLAFCVFETCCGMFWPSLGFMRSRYVPEEVRATVMNVFRIPLNLIVVVVLVNIGTLPESTVFFLCVALLAIAIYCQQALIALTVDSADAAKKSKVRVELDELGADANEASS